MNDKIMTAIKMLEAHGHSVQAQVRGEPVRMWFEIDHRMLASWNEMQELADGVYSFKELEELHQKRRAEKPHT